MVTWKERNMTLLFNSRNSLVVCILLGIVGVVYSNEFSFVSGALPPSFQGINQGPKEPITLEDVLGGTLSARGFSGQWVPDDGIFLNCLLDSKLQGMSNTLF